MTEAPSAPATIPAGTPAPAPAAPAPAGADYKALAEKWEGRAKSNYETLRKLGVTDDDTAAEVLRKVQQHDALEAELASDKDKAVAETKKATQAESDAKYRPLLVAAEFKAAAAGKIEPDRLAALVAPLDMSKFLTDKGDVDTAKVAAYVESVAPGKGTGRQGGPTPFGLGSRPPSAPAPGAQGLEMAKRRGYIKPAEQSA